MTQYTNGLEICLIKDGYDALEWQTHTNFIIKEKPERWDTKGRLKSNDHFLCKANFKLFICQFTHEDFPDPTPSPKIYIALFSSLP